MQTITREEILLLKPRSLVVIKNHTLILGKNLQIFTIARVLKNNKYPDNTEDEQNMPYPNDPEVTLKLETAGGKRIQLGEFTLCVPETVILREKFNSSAPRYLWYVKKRLFQLRSNLKRH